MFEKEMMQNIEEMHNKSLVQWVKPSDAYMMFLNGLCKEHRERLINDELEGEL